MKYTDKKCKHSSCLMSKVGLDYHCNKCGGVVVAYDHDFDDRDDYMSEVKADNDQETVNSL